MNNEINNTNQTPNIGAIPSTNVPAGVVPTTAVPVGSVPTNTVQPGVVPTTAVPVTSAPVEVTSQTTNLSSITAAISAAKAESDQKALDVAQSVERPEFTTSAGLGGATTIDINKAKELSKTPTVPKPEKEYKPPSKAKTIIMILFFIGIIAFIIFLPEVESFLRLNVFNRPQEEQEITSGTLLCTIEDNTVNLTIERTREFDFIDNKLEKARFTTVTKGDSTSDEDTLTNTYNKCKNIKEGTDSLTGVSISCVQEEGKVSSTESFDFSKYDVEKVSAAYSEAGGSILEYDYQTNIDSIMTAMQRSGFSCEKQK